MNNLLKKLGIKSHRNILILNSYDGFLNILNPDHSIDSIITNSDNLLVIDFAIIFVNDATEVKNIITDINNKLIGDCILWFAYPKKSSKKYKSNISRDSGFQVLGDYGFEPVSIIAIDEDFSALRFRKVEFIKTMKRNPNYTLSALGKAKASTTLKSK
ncbi:hypothetical protein ACFX5K_03090 [Rickettsiales bacterium LUAb2]